MKVSGHCRPCLEGLIKKTVMLSGADNDLVISSMRLLDKLFHGNATPPGIANELLPHIRKKTGVYDPYATIKYREFKDARSFIEKHKCSLDGSFGKLLAISALGNSTDFFTGGSFRWEDLSLSGEVDKVEEAIWNKGSEILFLGDNVGDFMFDVPLLRFLEKNGKKVYYAVREQPVQNDLSMEDVHRLGLTEMHPRIISTGTARVGLAREDIAGEVERLWNGGGPVIAKGMGNYETISEFDGERSVIYIMKIKCPAVAERLGHNIGTYIAQVR